MRRELGLITLIVRDYDEAIGFYVEKLGFVLREDRRLSPTKRWVVVASKQEGTGLLLAQAADERQAGAIGNQSGGRVFLFLETDDFARDHALYSERGVRFLEAPRREDYGTVAVFEDLHGNRWDLIERK
jgi:catechol 2,3-dioxygenase-like lactoylglutathione lyase family enzyme